MPQGKFNLPWGKFNPPWGKFNPPRGKFNPPRGKFNPPQGKFNPPQGKFNLPQGKFNLPWGKFNPPQGKFNPPRGKFNPPQGKFNPPQGKFNPPQGRLTMPRGRLTIPQGRLNPPSAWTDFFQARTDLDQARCEADPGDQVRGLQRQICARVEAIVRRIERQPPRIAKRAGAAVLSAAAVRAQKPFDQPANALKVSEREPRYLRFPSATASWLGRVLMAVNKHERKANHNTDHGEHRVKQRCLGTHQGSNAAAPKQADGRSRNNTEQSGDKRKRPQWTSSTQQATHSEKDGQIQPEERQGKSKQ
jgi:hypothetical protein